MDAKAESPNNDEVTVLDVTNYFGWRSKMKAYLKKFGVWEIVVNPPAQSNKKTKSVAPKDAKKDNTIALKFLMGFLSRSVKESLGEHTLAKDLWFKLESEYQGINQDTNVEAEVKSTEDEKQQEKEECVSNTSEGKNLSDYSGSDCENVEDDLEDAKKDVLAHLLADIDLCYNLRLKERF